MFLLFLFPLFLFAEIRLQEMTLEQKIGQLFIAPACPLRGDDHWEDWLRLLHEFHIGNVIVKQSDPVSQVQFLNALQAEACIPLLVAADAEWGLGMRMFDVLSFPRNMTLGAIDDLELIMQLGAEIGRQAKLVGIHMNLAPVADVNSNPANPIIHMRSFGEDPYRVAEHVAALSQGLKSAGTLACAKHFPGHGDTHIDSHRDLPFITHSLERLKTLEFIPFKKAIKEGIGAIMSAHLAIPSIDETYPASLSSSCLKTLLRQELDFQGLIVSDALNMRAVADRYPVEEIALLARKAGCDLLLYGAHLDPHVDEIVQDTIPRAAVALKRAYLNGELDLKELDESVLRILKAKEGIRPMTALDLKAALHTPEALALKKELFQESVTLIGENVFPIPEDSTYVSLGEGDVLSQEFTGKGDFTVVAVHQKEVDMAQIEELGDRIVLCWFASPYALMGLKRPKTVLLAYENDPEVQYAVLDILRGNAQAKGHLPITIDNPE